MSRADNDCVFCNICARFVENDLAFAMFDRYPVSTGHVLILTERHVASFFDTTADDCRACSIPTAVSDKVSRLYEVSPLREEVRAKGLRSIRPQG